MNVFLKSLSLILSSVLLASCQHAAVRGDWRSYGHDPGGQRYSPLKQIDRNNVTHLRRAWVYHTGELETKPKKRMVFECTPLAIDGVLFFITPLSRVIALDGATGEERWSFDPKVNLNYFKRPLANRGLAYWEGGGKRRIILPSRDGRIFSLDADTGQLDESFGDSGVVRLRETLTSEGRNFYISSPPAVYKNLIIQGCSIPDHPRQMPHAPVVALDAATGKIVWSFNTVPTGTEYGVETWQGDSWRGRGGNNVWSLISVDHKRGMVFLPVSGPNYDHFGGDRPGANLFSDSVVALDAESGERIWHYQTVHHDLWDYDLPAMPLLVDVKRGDRTIPAVVQVTKMGFVFVLDRITGEPLFPVEERPVPVSYIPDEAAWPTQPFPLKPPPIAKQGLSVEDLSRIDEETFAFVRDRFEAYCSEGLFTPPSYWGSVQLPGIYGGGNWSSGAIDPIKGHLFINTINSAWVIMLVPTPGEDFPYRANRWKFIDQNGYPANAPPWGQLTCVDLNSGEFVWQQVLGEYEELTMKGIPPTGTENIGGPILTAGGVLFIGATKDRRFRAFDMATGEVLFEDELDAAAFATPATYLGSNGKQYVVVSAGGGGELNAMVGDEIVAYELPDGLQ